MASYKRCALKPPTGKTKAKVRSEAEAMPLTLFDIHYDEFTTEKLRTIYNFYGIVFLQQDPKELLYDHLWDLRYLSHREQERIRNFVRNGVDMENAAPPRVTKKAVPNGVPFKKIRMLDELDENEDALVVDKNDESGVDDEFLATDGDYEENGEDYEFLATDGDYVVDNEENISVTLDDDDVMIENRAVRGDNTGSHQVENLIETECQTLPPPEALIECCVCMESLAAERFPKVRITSTCQHETTTCSSCLNQSIDSQIDHRDWDQVTCTECNEKLSYDDVKKAASDNGFQRYAHKSFLSAIDHLPGFTYCLGPNCGSGQIHAGGNDEPIMTCTTCQFKICYVHKMPWHTGWTCAQYDENRLERSEQEIATAKILADTTKTCPNIKCGYHIEKNNGCDHMTCRKCRHEFCWICFADYKAIQRHGNDAHEEDCLYHSRKIPGIPAEQQQQQQEATLELEL